MGCWSSSTPARSTQKRSCSQTSKRNGLEAGRLKREGRLLMRAEEEPLGGTRGDQLGRLIEEEGGEGSDRLGLLQLGEAGRTGVRPWSSRSS